ncbi:MAG: hypothetical protein J6Y93_01960, partial [Treponema sp.]|nr:hypothetical protein [Treponema sp.]
AERELGLRLIHNLDRNGFYILSPESFLHDGSGMEEYNILEATIDKIRQLDPVGTCVKNFEESLYVQAKFKGNAPEAALFILDGHFNFLNPPQPSKILKKINDYLKDTGKLSFLSEEKKQSLKKIKSMHFTEEDIQYALDFIRTLDPFPAKNFGTEQPNFISPDVYVEPVPEEDDDLQNGIVSATNNRSYKITLARDSLPSMRISRRFSSLAEKDTSSLGSDAKSEQEKADIKFARNSVQEAKTYMDSIAFRESTLEKATAEIIRNQSAFFEKGPRYLAPLRQKDIAGAIGVHEATISRMANAKYLQCQWGLFEIGYFFTNAVRTENTSSILAQMKDSPAASKEAVKFEIQSILRAHADEKKALSDQKVSDLLAEKGIIIARRTVAKYRSELNLASSYDR